jgi:hypothetical protein
LSNPICCMSQHFTMSSLFLWGMVVPHSTVSTAPMKCGGFSTRLKNGKIWRRTLFGCRAPASGTWLQVSIRYQSGINQVSINHIPWRIHGAGIYIYASMTGVYWWDLYGTPFF